MRFLFCNKRRKKVEVDGHADVRETYEAREVPKRCYSFQFMQRLRLRGRRDANGEGRKSEREKKRGRKMTHHPDKLGNAKEGK